MPMNFPLLEVCIVQQFQFYLSLLIVFIFSMKNLIPYIISPDSNRVFGLFPEWQAGCSPLIMM